MKAYKDTASLILNLGTNLMLRPLYPGKKARYLLNRRLAGLQSRSGGFGEENKLHSIGIFFKSLSLLTLFVTELEGSYTFIYRVHLSDIM